MKSSYLRSTLLLVIIVWLTAVPPALAATDDGDAFALNEQAVALIDKGEHSQAIAKLTRAVELDPTSEVIRNNLAEARFRLGAQYCDRQRFDLAATELAAAIALRPDRDQYHVFLGVAQYQLGDLEPAVATLKRALTLDPEEAAAHENLGHVYYKLGQSEDAIREWKQALAMGTETATLAKLVARVTRETEVEAAFLEARAEYFDIRYDGSLARDVVETTQRGLDGAYQRVGSLLGFYPDEPVPVVLYTRAGFSRVTDGHRWVAGLFDGRIRIPIDRDQRLSSQLEGTLAHEYTHYAIHDMAPRCPTWLHEGIAQYAERSSVSQAAARVARARSRIGSVFALTESFAQTTDPAAARLQYDQALAFVGYVVENYGEGSLASLLRELGRSGDVRAAVSAVLGIGATQLEEAWMESLTSR